MIFAGDVAIGEQSIGISMPRLLRQNPWLMNLEGSLVMSGEFASQKVVFNTLDAVKWLQGEINLEAVSLANNHILNVCDVETTLDNAKSLGLSAFGAGRNIKEASRPLKWHGYTVISFGWECIECVVASEKKKGVNPYESGHVLRQVNSALSEGKKVICFFHWGYELERYPHPYDRQFAMKLIDMGVSAVIGCHAHRVQPVEFYKERPIVYGLGNFTFMRGYYMDGKLNFPKFSEDEYAFEMNEDRFVLHHFMYDSKENRLEYVKSEEIGPDRNFDGKAEFTGFTAKEYDSWFKVHRVQRKLLPVFNSSESAFSYAIKSKWIKTRGALINFLMKANLKSADRAD